MSRYDKALEQWALAIGIGYPGSCPKCPERKEGCYKKCRFIKAYKNENDVPRYIKLPQPEYLPPTAEELEQFAGKLYQSPIEILMQEMQTQFDDEVFKATQAYGINVDKDELIKALQYDRDQYNKGFVDGCMIDKDVIKQKVAREIFEQIEKTLNRKIAHWLPHLEDLEKRESHLSIWGYKDMGYFKGIIVTCEDLQDLIDELKKKYTEGQK